MPRTLTRNTFLQRLIGAAALDPAIYEEVEADPAALGQATAVVVLSSLAVGFGARGLGTGPMAMFSFSAIALVMWASWALVVFEVGSRILPDPETRTTPGELLRTIGFSATPGLVAVLAAVPGVTVQILVGVLVWMFVAMIVAVRHALDYQRTLKAVMVCLLGWLLAAVVALVIGFVLGPKVS